MMYFVLKYDSDSRTNMQGKGNITSQFTVSSYQYIFGKTLDNHFLQHLLDGWIWETFLYFDSKKSLKFSGYEFDNQDTCIDVDECLNGDANCDPIAEFCLNNQGN